MLELAEGTEPEDLFEGLDYMLLGHTSEKQVIAINDDVIPLVEAEKAYSTPLEGIFPSKTDEKDDKRYRHAAL